MSIVSQTRSSFLTQNFNPPIATEAQWTTDGLPENAAWGGGLLVLGGFSNVLACEPVDVFAVPLLGTANINVTVSGVLSHNPAALGTRQDAVVYLIEGGAIIATKTITGNNWVGAFSIGGDSTFWGVALTPALVNSASFGCGFLAQVGPLIATATQVSVESLVMEATYEIPSPNTVPSTGSGGGNGGFGTKRQDAGLPDYVDMTEDPEFDDCESWGDGLRPPKGWEDPDKRNQLAAYIVRQIENFDTNMMEKKARFELARMVYEDQKVMSSMVFPPGVTPYNLPLIKQLVDTVVGNTASYLSESSPIWIFEDGKIEDREKAESDFDLLWRSCRANLTIREIAKDAAINGRGAFRVYWENQPKGEGWSRNVFSSNRHQYAGLRIEPIPLSEIFYAPVASKVPETTVVVGHRFYRSRQWVIGMQNRGVYFNDVEVSPTNRNQERLFSVDDDFATELATEQVCLAHGQVLWAGEDGCDKPKAWRFTLDYESQQLLALEPYDYPRHEYFFPSFDTSSGDFWPDNSIGSSLLELSGVTNDAWTIALMSTQSQSQPSAIASGFTPASKSERIGLGTIHYVKGDPKITTLPVSGNANGATYIIGQAEKVASGVARVSQLGAGQQLTGNLTATEVAEIAAGQNASKTDYYSVFLDQMIECAQFCLWLLAENFREFKEFHGERVQSRSAKGLRYPFNIRPKNVTPKSNPRIISESMRDIMGAVRELGGQITPLSRRVSGDALLTALLEVSELPVAPEALLEDEPTFDEQPAIGGDQGPIAQGIAGEGAIPPELLEQLFAGQGGMAPEGVGIAPSELPGI